MQSYFATANNVIALQQVPKPTIETPTDIIVEVHAAATNPTDSKTLAARIEPKPRAVGYDASGVVVQVGPEAKGFQVGDEVFYAGESMRSGSYAEFQSVDSRIVALKPKSISHNDAAAFPLVSVTAYEALYETMQVQAGKSILILAASGGVGSIAIQLAKLAGLKVIATASRAETKAWVLKLGADVVVDHTKSFESEFQTAGLAPVEYVLNLYSLKDLSRLVPIIAPRGHICSIIADADIPKDTIFPLFWKRVTLSWEMMYSRTSYNYEREVQGEILAKIAKLIDEGKLQTITGPQTFQGFASLPEAFKLQNSGKAIGKIVVQLK